LVAARVPAKQRIVKITGVIDTIASKAYENGLAQDALEKLVDIVTQPNELDLASVTTLIKNLYPAGRVSDELVLRVVACFGHGKAKAAFPVQAALLKWLIMVYDTLENPKVLSQLYSILFNLLDTIAIRFDQVQYITRRPLTLLELLFVISCLSLPVENMSDLSEYRCCRINYYPVYQLFT
jgi:centromere protein I